MAPGASGQPPAKRRRVTAEEKAKLEREAAAKKKEKGELKTAKEKAAALQKEEKEKMRAEKAAEKAKAEAEKKARQEEREKKKREKEEEERLEKEKKEKAQPKIAAFFKFQPTTPKKAGTATPEAGTPRDGSPSPLKQKSEEVSDYRKRFMPFFVKEHVRLADQPFAIDDKTKEVKSAILDEYLRGDRGTFDPRPFNPAESLQLPPLSSARGRTYPSVQKIMSEHQTSSGPVDLTTESQNAQIRQTRELLRQVPMKFLGFREDVRPAYYGTVTSHPSRSLRKLARSPVSRGLLPLNYDYDSEAEWQDDGEGEDLDDLDDEEEELDDDEEMGDFLDDSEDAGRARAAFSGFMEPDSTGLCWENRKRLGPLANMYKYRMEFILGKSPQCHKSYKSLPCLSDLDHHSEIDPFSTKYWEPEVAPTTRDRKPLTAGASNDTAGSTPAMAPPPAPADAFAALTSAATKADAKKALMPAELLDDFKKVILDFSELTKVGVIEVLSSKFPKCTKNQVRNSLEEVAERVNKVWRLKT